MDDTGQTAGNDENTEPAPGVGSSADDPVDRLQSAARDVIDAARSFLDLLQDVVDDRDRVQGLVDTFTGFVEGMAGPANAPGPEHAGSGASGPDGPEDPDDDPGDDVQPIPVS